MTLPTDTDVLRSLKEAQRKGLGSLGQKAIALERLLAISQEISTLDLPVALRRILLYVLEWTGTTSDTRRAPTRVGSLILMRAR